MANIRRLPPTDVAAELAVGPETDAERADRLEAQVNLLEAENGVLRRYLNDIEKLTQRVLALRAGRGRLLLLLIAAAILLYGSIPGTPLNRVLVAAWQAVIQPARSHDHAYSRQPFYEPIADPSPTLSPAAVPSTSVPQATPAASPIPVIVSKPKISPLPLPIPSSLPTCLGNHLPIDPICPPMGHKPKPSPEM